MSDTGVRVDPGTWDGKTPKGFLRGTHRLIPPEETWERIVPLLPRYGVTRVADLTGLDRIGVPVAAAIRPQSRSIAVAAGKGVSLAAAKVSAAMEAIECAHAETIDRPLLFASRAEIVTNHAAPELDALPQLRGASIDDDTRILWIEGRTLADAPMMVPYELVHAHYCPYGLPGSKAFLATTNGLASGNCLAEAACHALFEIIERDALSLWVRRPRRLRHDGRLELARDDAPEAGEILQRLAGRGFRTAVWNITSDVGVPTFHALIVDEDDPAGHPGTGTGCHADSGVALFRAVTEAAQVRAVYISGGRDDLNRREYELTHINAFRQQLEEAPRARHRFAEIGSSRSRYFEIDIAKADKALRRVGCGPVIVVDLSHPGTGISVVRVVVPGLEGSFEADARPGRRARAIAG